MSNALNAVVKKPAESEDWAGKEKCEHFSREAAD
jgi:hypothetical protein